MRLLFFICLIILGRYASAQSDALNEQVRLTLNGYTIVGLGEEGHGFESINKAKAALTLQLHRELNFSSILFESSFTLSVVEYLRNDSLVMRMNNFLYPFWNTTSVKKILEPFYSEEKKSGYPAILGFDLQEDCRFPILRDFLLSKKIIIKQKNYLIQADSILALFIGQHFSRRETMSSEELQLALSNYDSVSSELIHKFDTTSIEIKLLRRCIFNRKTLCQYLSMKNNRMLFRDSVMAENVKWLKEELFTKQKIILWTANTHVSKSDFQPKWMGEWISQIYKDEYVAIACFNGEPIGLPMLGNYRYDFEKTKKFDLSIYTGKRIKIAPGEWITPCYNYIR